MLTNPTESAPASNTKVNTLAAKRNQNLNRIKTALRDVPIFKKNIILNKKRLSEFTTPTAPKNLDLSPTLSPLAREKVKEKVETV
jgi:hypothetical protein